MPKCGARMKAFEWSLVTVAILGTLCVSGLQEVFAGHLFWLVSNTGLLLLNAYLRRWPMLALFAVYLALAIYGLIRWA